MSPVPIVKKELYDGPWSQRSIIDYVVFPMGYVFNYKNKPTNKDIFVNEIVDYSFQSQANSSHISSNDIPMSEDLHYELIDGVDIADVNILLTFGHQDARSLTTKINLKKLIYSLVFVPPPGSG